jgi:hypothetical protein
VILGTQHAALGTGESLAEHAQPTPKRRIRPETSAWITLLTFFVVFCTLVAGAGWWGWTYYSTAMIPRGGGLLRGHVNAGVTLQARGQLAPESLERPPADRDPCLGQQDVCQYVDEGYHIRTKREAGYGPRSCCRIRRTFSSGHIPPALT